MELPHAFILGTYRDAGCSITNNHVLAPVWSLSSPKCITVEPVCSQNKPSSIVVSILGLGEHQWELGGKGRSNDSSKSSVVRTTGQGTDVGWCCFGLLFPVVLGHLLLEPSGSSAPTSARGLPASVSQKCNRNYLLHLRAIGGGVSSNSNTICSAFRNVSGSYDKQDGRFWLLIL